MNTLKTFFRTDRSRSGRGDKQKDKSAAATAATAGPHPAGAPPQPAGRPDPDPDPDAVRHSIGLRFGTDRIDPLARSSQWVEQAVDAIVYEGAEIVQAVADWPLTPTSDSSGSSGSSGFDRLSADGADEPALFGRRRRRRLDGAAEPGRFDANDLQEDDGAGSDFLEGAGGGAGGAGGAQSAAAREYMRRQCLLLRAEMGREGWGEDALELFFRLRMRGFEPVVPPSWQLDFQTWPEVLFGGAGADEPAGGPMIRAKKGPEFHAIKALMKLISAGPHIREAFLRGRGGVRPEALLEEAVGDYLSWALADGGVQPAGGGTAAVPANFAVLTRPVSAPVEELQGAMADEFGRLAAAWLDWFGRRSGLAGSGRAVRLPTLYGIVASGSLFAIVCYEIGAPRPSRADGPMERWRRVWEAEDWIELPVSPESPVFPVLPSAPAPAPAPAPAAAARSGFPAGVSKLGRLGNRARGGWRRRRARAQQAQQQARPATVVKIDNEDGRGVHTGRVRTVGTFDFAERKFDVWNMIAVAILVMHVRERLGELAEFGVLG